jgi:hypothetical protein
MYFASCESGIGGGVGTGTLGKLTVQPDINKEAITSNRTAIATNLRCILD